MLAITLHVYKKIDGLSNLQMSKHVEDYEHYKLKYTIYICLSRKSIIDEN
jgi:hypothetical protein